MKKRNMLKRIAACMMAGTLALSVLLGSTVTADAKKKKDKEEPVAEVDLDAGVYHAAMGVQTGTTKWLMRPAYFEDTNNGNYGTDLNDSLTAIDNETRETVAYDGTFTDAEIAGNGTYTLKLEGADFSGEVDMTQLYIATDIPLNDTIKFTNVSATVNGRNIANFDEAFMENEEDYLIGGMCPIILNHWRAELVTQLQDQGLFEGSNGYNILTGAGNENIEITFTVSGFNYDNENATAENASAGEDTSLDSSDGTNSSDDTNTVNNTTTSDNTSESSVDNEEDGSSNTMMFVIIAIVVVVIIIIVAAVAMKKKED